MKIVAFCPVCGRETVHEVLRVRSGTVQRGEVLIRCTRCGNVHTVVRGVEEPREVELGITVSWLGESEFRRFSVREDRTIAVGDVVEVEGVPVRVTRVEAGVPVERARASEITALWGVRYDRVRLKVALRGEKIRHYTILEDPNRVLRVGEEMEVLGRRGRIRSLRLRDGRRLKRGSAPAGEVVKVYLDEVTGRPPGRGPRASR